MKGNGGRWHEVPCRPALFMRAAVQTHNLRAPVGPAATVAAKEPHYCHRGHILFGAKLGLHSLLFSLLHKPNDTRIYLNKETQSRAELKASWKPVQSELSVEESRHRHHGKLSKWGAGHFPSTLECSAVIFRPVKATTLQAQSESQWICKLYCFSANKNNI